MRDIQDNRKCPIDTMLQELTYLCTDQPESDFHSEEKATLLENVLNDVMKLCDEDSDMKKIMKQHLSEL
jgi:ribosomal protein S4E